MTGLRILVVDDEPFVRSTLSMLLRLEGHVVSVAVDGREGLQAALEQQPDLILTDIHMPHLSGLELLSAVRAEAGLAHTRVVLLTGDSLARPLTAAEQPDARLPKPFTRDQLLAVLGACRLP